MNIKLQFKVERSLGDPTIKIQIDEGMPAFNGPCPDNISLDIPVSAGEHELRITHYGKKKIDHIWDDDGNVVVDKHCEIEKIWFDNVELKEILWEGEFYPVYEPSYVATFTQKGERPPYSITPNLYLGHNGLWKLAFEYPATAWMVEKRLDTFNTPPSHTFSTTKETIKSVKEFINNVDELDWKIND